MRNIIFFWVVSLILLSGFSAQAQDHHRKLTPEGAPRLGILTAEMLSDGKIVKDAPYSATALRERVQILENGSRISHQVTDVFVRDSEGRTRHEATQNGFGAFSLKGQAATMIFIQDVVAKKHFALDPGEQTVRYLSKVKIPPPLDFAPPAAANQKTESLGKKIIEGIEAEGTRSTITIPIGEIGNDRSLEIISERWESPELQVVILSKHNDPRMGETIFRLTNIKRDEPAKSLFEVPTNYKTLSDEIPQKKRGKNHREED